MQDAAGRAAVRAEDEVRLLAERAGDAVDDWRQTAAETRRTRREAEELLRRQLERCRPLASVDRRSASDVPVDDQRLDVEAPVDVERAGRPCASTRAMPWSIARPADGASTASSGGEAGGLEPGLRGRSVWRASTRPSASSTLGPMGGGEVELDLQPLELVGPRAARSRRAGRPESVGHAGPRRCSSPSRSAMVS